MLIIKDYKDYPQSTIGRGHDMAAFVKDGSDEHMMLVWSMDSGRGDGGISFWSWNSPGVWEAPVLRKHLKDAALREAHSTPVTNMVGDAWKTWVLQATNGFSVYDITSIQSPTLKTNYSISGSSRGGSGSVGVCSGPCLGGIDASAKDYDGGGVWYIGLAAPYIYVAQVDAGLNIYKFTDRADPTKIKWVKRLDKSFFGHRVNQALVMGNLLVAAATDSERGLTLLDIGNPESPVKVSTDKDVHKAYAYSLGGNTLLAASKYLKGVNESGITVYGLDTKGFKLSLKRHVKGGCSSGGYVSLQDQYAHVGLSTCYAKIDINTGTILSPRDNPWRLGITGADNDFTTPMGNTVFVGNDHHTTPGSAVLCHAGSIDLTRPKVTGTAPADLAQNIPVTTGVGVAFSDNLKPWTIKRATLPVRRQGADQALSGSYSYQLNVVNFRPSSTLALGTTYEVKVTWGGITDLAGNGTHNKTTTFVTSASTSRADFARPGWSLAQNLQEGQRLFANGTARFTAIPDALRARTWVRPGEEARVAADEALVRLDLAGPTVVRACFDERAAVPAWAEGWKGEGEGLTVADGPLAWTLACRSRLHPRGPMTLGGAERPYALVLGPEQPEDEEPAADPNLLAVLPELPPLTTLALR